MNDSHRHRTLAGIFCMIGATLSLTLMGMCVKRLGGYIPVSQIMFCRFGVGLVLLLPFVFTLKSFSFKVATPGHYVIRICSALFAVGCSYFALGFIPLADVYLLTNTAALFVPFVAYFLLKTKLLKGVTGMSCIGFAGAILVLKPDSGIISAPALIALLAGLFVAISIVELRLIGGKSTPLQMTFYYQLIGALCSGLIVCFQWKPLHSPLLIWNLVGVALFGFIYQWALTYAMRIASARVMSPLLFLSVFYGVIIDWIVWDHIPTLITGIGMILVVGGAIATVWYGQRSIYGKK